MTRRKASWLVVAGLVGAVLYIDFLWLQRLGWEQQVKQVLFWLFIIFCVVDSAGGFAGWVELRSDSRRSSQRLAPVMLAGAYRSFVTIVGLMLFGINVKTRPWYLVLGVSAVAYKGYGTWSWLAYLHGLINGEGWWGLVKKLFKPKSQE